MHRWTLAALPLLVITNPLPAQAAERELADAAATLSDPIVQDRMADTVASIVGAMLEMPIGPLAEAVARIGPDSDAAYIPPDATVGDVAGRDPEYGERLGDDVRASARMASSAASTMAVYAPVLKDMARDLLAQWKYERDATRR